LLNVAKAILEIRNDETLLPLAGVKDLAPEAPFLCGRYFHQPMISTPVYDDAFKVADSV